MKEAHRPSLTGVPISRVVIDRKNVFEDDRKPTWLFGTLNVLHVTTRERVIARELLLQKGDLYDAALAAETERVLRRLDFIANARVFPRPLDDGTVELRVETQDRFTLRAGASVGLFSGESVGRVSLGEGNLMGLGKEFRVRYREGDVDDLRFSYKDPQFLTSHHIFRLAVGDSDEGGSVDVSLQQPFRTLETDLGYSLRLRHVSNEVNYFEFGDDYANIPRRLTALSGDISHAFGPREFRRKLGMRFRLSNDRFRDTEGESPERVRNPGDVVALELGPTFSLDYIPFFARKTRIDSIGAVEDIPLGVVVNGFTGLQWRDQDGEGKHLDPLFSLETRLSQQFYDNHLVTLLLAGRARWRGDSVRGWGFTGQLHYYYQGLPHQTLATSLTFDAQGERDGLDPQLTLGEDNGLRGYDVRFFSGDRRIRLNLEDRIYPDFDILSVRVGAVVFFDAGLAFEHGAAPRLNDFYKSVGFGFRFGSPQLVRRDVVRLDIAFPLDDHPQGNFGISLSASAGQIFDLFGNSEGIDREF